MARLVKLSILSQENILVLLVPAILYYSISHLFGIFWCILVLSIYGCFVSTYSTRKSIVAFFFSLFGLIEWMISLHVPVTFLESSPLILVITSAMQIALIMLVFSFLRFPLPMFLAEAACNKLKESHRLCPDDYLRMWQKVSMLWTTIFVGKALLFYCALSATPQQAYVVILLLGWPLYCITVLISVLFIRHSASKLGIYFPV